MSHTLGASVHAQDRPLDRQLAEAFADGKLAGLHGVLIKHKGEILAESYFPGEDWRWGQPLGMQEHGAETLHDLRSITKSVVGLLYGIALDEGKVPSPDAKLLDQFPDYPDLAGDPLRQAILVRHALSMQMGTQWNESLPYSDPKNSEIAMERAKDRYRFILDRPMTDRPGSLWVYNGGATAVIAKLIADGVGMPIDAYAKAKLFSPLGIKEFEWVRGSDGVPSAASGLRLKLRDLVKIGQLLLQDGKFDGRQIVPADWLKQSFTPRGDAEDILRYGYFWWLAPPQLGEQPVWAAGFGNGGQRLTIQPSADFIIAVFAGNYNQPDAWKLPVRILEEFAAPAVRDRLQKQ